MLKLAPDDHTEEVFKQILGSCQSIVASLGAIRNKLGDAHSQGPLRAKSSPRHAEPCGHDGDVPDRDLGGEGAQLQFLIALPLCDGFYRWSSNRKAFLAAAFFAR
jgi:hypothetical protein